MSLFEELKRRNVFRVGIAYAISAWVLLQIADLVIDNIVAPDWVMHVLMLLVGLGFIVALVIAWAYEMTPEGIKKEADVDRTKSVTHETSKKLDKITLAALGVVVVLVLADRFIAKPDNVDPQNSHTATSAEKGPDTFSGENMPTLSDTTDQKLYPAPVSEKSIAVLPFANMSDDASNEFFADGISEEILNALAQVKGLKVAGRTSAFAFKGRNEDLRTIGEALGVNHVLEGSVRKAGNTVRVTAQLIQVSDGFHLWSNTWDRELTDIFAIQDEIAGAILKQLKAELIDGQSIASDRVDPIIYEKYLLAKQRPYSRTTLDLEIAANLLKEATEADPTFAAAWAQRAIATALLADDDYGTIPKAQAQRDMKQYLDKALEIDENQAEALAGMGLYYNNQPGGASVVQKGIPYLERALELNPTLIDASNWLQMAYIGLERDGDSLRILEQMFNRDPLYKPGTANLVYAYSLRGQTEAANRVIERVRPYIRDEAWVARFEANILSLAGRFGEAYEKAVFGSQKDPDNPQAQLSLEFVLLGLGMNEELAALENSSPFFGQAALSRLGRVEEGLRYAQNWSDRLGAPGFMIYYYHTSSQAQKLVDFVESRWPDLEVFSTEFPANPGFGYADMYQLAYAYAQTGNLVKYEQALSLARDAHDLAIEKGYDTRFTQMAEVSYWAIAGDTNKALDHLQRALDIGASFPLSDIALFPEYQDLKAEPKFRQLTVRAHEQFNQQRVLAGLEPIDPESGP